MIIFSEHPRRYKMKWNMYSNRFSLFFKIFWIAAAFYGVYTFIVVTRSTHKPKEVANVNESKSEVYREFDATQLNTSNESRLVVTPKPPPPKPEPRIVNVYNISNTEVIDTSYCINTRTPSVFVICTWDLNKDRYISADIHRTGQWEPGITRKIFDVLIREKNDTVTFIDIGANIGYFSLLAASVGQKVIAVEPWEENIKKFAKSIRLNKFEGRITVVKNIISNTRRVERIDVLRPDNMGANRIINEEENIASTKDSFYAKGIFLSDLKTIIKTEDVVIKIDVEGHECRAFEKANKIFDRYNVMFISMEWEVMQLFQHNHGVACPPQNIQNMVDMLTRREFIPYSFEDNLRLDPKKHYLWKYTDIYWKRKISTI